jgi:hypothetical protein
MNQEQNPKISSPAMLALIDQINESPADEREHVWMAMQAIYKEAQNYGIHGVVALSLVDHGLMYAIKRGD